jgi:hypothetical protein
MEEGTLTDINPAKITIITRFKREIWSDTKIGNKRKLNYYKETNSSKLEDRNCLFIITSTTNKINVVNIKINSHTLHNEIEHRKYLNSLT